MTRPNINTNRPVQIGSGFFVQVAAGSSHSAAIGSDGTLWTWGGNSSGELGNGTSANALFPMPVGNNFAQVAMGNEHTVAIKTDGTLWAWGSNTYGQLGMNTNNTRIPNKIGSGFSQVAAGLTHTVAIKNDATLWSWGSNFSGESGNGSTTSPIFNPVAIGSEFGLLTSGGNSTQQINAILCGNPTGVTVRAVINPAIHEVDVQLKAFVVALLPNGSMLSLSQGKWSVGLQAYNSFNGSHPFTVEVLNNLNYVGSGLGGTKIFVGYGTDMNQMISESKYKLVYTLVN